MLPSKIRTATVTWITYENYGTYLQAYAFQQILKSLGYDNQILDDNKIASPPSVRLLLSKIKRAVLRKKKPESAVLYNQFRKEYLRIYNGFSDEREVDDLFDVFLCGSDQIWSPYLEFNPYYYLGFTNKKKIAYAPSTGTGTCTEEYRKNVKPLIERFSAVAVREESGAKMLSSFIEKEIHTVLDPTLLLASSDWEKIAKPGTCETDYIICYFLTPNTWYLDYVKEYAARHNKRLLIFSTRPEYKTYGRTVVAGPQEFVSYIRSADKVFTDSYHASIFSILFQKDFITFKRFEDGKFNDQNARVYGLFEKLDLSNYFIGRTNLSMVEQLSLPDYDRVEAILSQLREDSINYLKTALQA